VDAEQVTMLINRGMEYLKSGDFPSARLLLKRAAEAGSPGAALMLGATFDPLFLPRLSTNGIEPDLAQARRWYEKALELGADGASQRLAELGRVGK
jgi:TPR repeat protein